MSKENNKFEISESDRETKDSTELRLHHYNWSLFHDQIIQIHQAKFGMAGEELVLGVEIDWELLKPKVKDYCLEFT